MLDWDLASERDTRELGEQRLTCAFKRELIWAYRITAALLALVGLYFMVGSVLALADKPADAQGGTAKMLGFAGAGIVILGFGALFLVPSNRFQSWHLVVFDHGLVHE